jgi:phospholipase/lecithinase/hemolysin
MRIRQLIYLAIAAAVLSSLALAGPFTHLIVYGDSLSDNGNYNAQTGRVPAPFYWNGRVSNGPVAAEIMQGIMGVALIDHAWAGATTGVGNINDIPTSGTTTPTSM